MQASSVAAAPGESREPSRTRSLGPLLIDGVWNYNADSGPATDSAVDNDPAMVQIANRPGYCQAEAATSRSARSRFVDSIESVKDQGYRLFWYPLTRIHDVDDGITRVLDHSNRYVASRTRVFNGVVDQVYQDLA